MASAFYLEISGGLTICIVDPIERGRTQSPNVAAAVYCLVS